MFQRIFAVLFYPLLIFASQSEEILDCVDLRSGKILCTQVDLIVDAIEPIKLSRTWRARHKDRLFVPHLSLSFDDAVLKGGIVCEPDGKKIYYKKTADQTYRPVGEAVHNDPITARNNPHNNVLTVVRPQKKMKLSLPTGGYRIYKISRDGEKGYLLRREVLPNGHRIEYLYDSYDRLMRIQTMGGDHTYAWIHFNFHDSNQLSVNTNLGQRVDYEFEKHDNVFYLTKVRSPTNSCASADLIYAKQTDKKRCLKQYFIDGHIHLDISYRDQKVSHLNMSDAEGKWFTARNFSYFSNYTETRDAANILTRYHFSDSKVHKVEFFKEKDQLHSMQVLDGCNKSLYDANGALIFQKRFTLDAFGNVLKEEFIDGVTGICSSRTFEYANHLPIRQQDDSGLVILFQYKKDTDLLESKQFLLDGKIFKRQFYQYSPIDHRLQEEIVDDGSSENPVDLQNVTERKLQRVLDFDSSQMPKEEVFLYWDKDRQGEILIQRKKYSYSNNKVSKEEIYGSDGKFAYSIEYEYDAQGHQICKRFVKDDLIKEDRCSYNRRGQLIYESFANSPVAKEYEYGPRGTVELVVEHSSDGKRVQKRTKCDRKGDPVQVIDERGQIINSDYDPFSNLVRVQFPLVLDENRIAYHPEVIKMCDVQGNDIKTTNAKGYFNTAKFNATRDPIEAVDETGGISQFSYHSDRTLASFTNALGVVARYTYDTEQRITKRAIYSKEEELLSQESWTYDAFHIRSHTDAQGRITHFFYDGAGRKIKEEVDGHAVSFSYDPLGRVDTIQDLMTLVTHRIRFDHLGQKQEEWVEEPSGKIEDHIVYEYDSYGKITQLIRGKAIDSFQYDGWGRKVEHIDPEGHRTVILYDDEYVNGLGQKVLQKKTIDPSGLECIETFDALERIHQIEKKVGNTICHQEEIYYNRSGHRASVVDHVFHEGKEIKVLETQWEYDALGRVQKEIEPGGKTTETLYDVLGRVVKTKKHNGVILEYSYDELDRLKELRTVYSPEGVEPVHYQFSYETSQYINREPTKIWDVVARSNHERRFERGRLIAEWNGDDVSMQWDYDKAGRVVLTKLPDFSKIGRTYQGSHLYKVIRGAYSYTYEKRDDHGLPILEQLPFNAGEIETQYDLLDRTVMQKAPWDTQSRSFASNGVVAKRDSLLFGPIVYGYDPLSQLITENQTTYSFDSLGNPTDIQSNERCELIRDDLAYDLNGNLIQRGEYQFSYDAMDRLVKIETPEEIIVYAYDAFNRLQSRKAGMQSQRFIYDADDTEIGSIDEHGKLTELRLLGEKRKEDLGATVAIEIGEQVYLPIHDLKGNIVGLAIPGSTKVEQYPTNAFGQSSAKTSISPWRYASKRHLDADLVYYGHRFYDPSLKRWLTPDPAGSIDSRNRYLFLLNSPTNRLDRWGLFVEFEHTPLWSIDRTQSYIWPQFDTSIIANMKVLPDVISQLAMFSSNIIIHGNNVHTLCSNPSESFNTKAAEWTGMLSKAAATSDSGILGTMLVNGINVSSLEFTNYVALRSSSFQDQILTIGSYNESAGFIHDFGKRMNDEMQGMENFNIEQLRTQVACAAKACSLLGPNYYFTFELHSEAGLQYNIAYEGLAQPLQELVQQHILVIALGVVRPVPDEFGFDVVNIYSEKDIAYSSFGKNYVGNPKFTIEVVDCMTPKDKLPSLIGDHGYLGETYKKHSIEAHRKLDDHFRYLRIRK